MGEKMSTDFTLKSEVQHNCLILTTAGYINNTGGERIAQEFYSHQSSGVKNVILDLSGTKVVNSIGISYLIEIIEKLNESGGKMVFTNLDPSIDKTFLIMGLYQFAQKVDRVEEALNSLSHK